MSVPAAKKPGRDSWCETIRYALEDTPRTLRLCLIMIAQAASCALAVVIVMRCGSVVGHAVSQLKTWL